MEFSSLLLLTALIQGSTSYVTWRTVAGCHIDAHSLYPWLVSIWYRGNDDRDTKTHARYGQGVLITHRAVLTACSPNGQHTPNRFYLRNTPDSVKNFQVYAQRINLTALIVDKIPEEDAVQCDLMMPVIKYIEHPKCRWNPQGHWDQKRVEQLFNFAGFVTFQPLPFLGDYYPTLPLPLSPESFISDVSYINIIEDYSCEVVWFEPRGAPSRHIVIGGRAFPGAPLVKAIPFQTKCLQKLCEEKPNFHNHQYDECLEFFGRRANATRLCMKPKWTNRLVGKINDELVRSYTYIGAPLVCNGTGYGHVSFVKERPLEVFKDRNDIGDFFFVTTYLRAWPWIMEFKRNYTAETRDFYIERLHLKTESVPAPKKIRIDDQVLEFRRPKLPYQFDPPEILRDKDRRSEGTYTALNPFVGFIVTLWWLGVPNLEPQLSETYRF